MTSSAERTFNLSGKLDLIRTIALSEQGRRRYQVRLLGNGGDGIMLEDNNGEAIAQIFFNERSIIILSRQGLIHQTSTSNFKASAVK